MYFDTCRGCASAHASTTMALGELAAGEILGDRVSGSSKETSEERLRKTEVFSIMTV